MFGKKLSKGFLVDTNGSLVKEFVFSTKVDVDFSQTLAAIQALGGFANVGAFSIGKGSGMLIKGAKLHFITVGKDLPDDEDVALFREMLGSVEKTFDAGLDLKLKNVVEAEQRAKLEQETAKKGNEELNTNRNDLALEGVALEELRMELDHLRQETEKWQDELKDFETKVNNRHSEINERVGLLLEREQNLVKNQQAFEVAASARRGLIRKMQEAVAESIDDSETALVRARQAEKELEDNKKVHHQDVTTFQA